MLLIIVLLSSVSHLCAAQQLNGGITADFRTFLTKHNYSQWLPRFARDDLVGYGSYGGRSTPCMN